VIRPEGEVFRGPWAKSIVIDSNVNRHFDVLHAIRICDCELKLLVNEGCLYRCHSGMRILIFSLMLSAGTKAQCA